MGYTINRSAHAVAWALCLSATAHAGLVNGDFETGDLSGWTLTSPMSFTGVDAFAARTGAYGAYFGEDAPGSSIAQAFSTVAGATYEVAFWVQLDDSAVPNAFSWSWDDAVQAGALTDATGFSYQRFSALVTATGASTTLKFNFVNQQSFYLLDDVSVSMVPEPASMALVLTALTGLGMSTRRKTVRRS